jgi:hypothetical protein
LRTRIKGDPQELGQEAHGTIRGIVRRPRLDPILDFSLRRKPDEIKAKFERPLCKIMMDILNKKVDL